MTVLETSLPRFWKPRTYQIPSDARASRLWDGRKPLARYALRKRRRQYQDRIKHLPSPGERPIGTLFENADKSMNAVVNDPRRVSSLRALQPGQYPRWLADELQGLRR